MDSRCPPGRCRRDVPGKQGKLVYLGAGFYDLRRAYPTSLVADRVDMKTAQSMLRHSDARLTIGLYAEVEAENQRLAERSERVQVAESAAGSAEQAPRTGSAGCQVPVPG
jgi:hypothetical protein